MAKDFAVRVVNARKVAWAELAADLAVGYTDNGKFVGLFVVPDLVLKRKKSDGSYYYQGPRKPYIKNGEPVKDENGFDRYLEFFQLYREKGGGDDPSAVATTKASWEFRKYLISLLVDAAQKIGVDVDARPAARSNTRTSRPAPRREAAKAAPEAAATVIDEDEVGAPGDDEDDSWPF